MPFCERNRSPVFHSAYEKRHRQSIRKQGSAARTKDRLKINSRISWPLTPPSPSLLPAARGKERVPSNLPLA